jgi:hypothetical protein
MKVKQYDPQPPNIIIDLTATEARWLLAFLCGGYESPTDGKIYFPVFPEHRHFTSDLIAALKKNGVPDESHT